MDSTNNSDTNDDGSDSADSWQRDLSPCHYVLQLGTRKFEKKYENYLYFKITR